MRRGRRIARWLLRLLGCSAVVLLGAAIYLHTIGFPRWAVRKLLPRLSTGSYAMEAAHVRLASGCGLKATSVGVYRKREVGPPLLRAGTAYVFVDPRSLARNGPWRVRVRLENGSLVRRPGRRGQPSQPSGETDIRARIELHLVNMQYAGIALDPLRCEVRVDGSDWSVAGIESVVKRAGMEGRWTGSAVCGDTPRRLTGRLTTDVNPHVCLPLLEAWNLSFPAALIQQFDFGSAVPRCEATFRRGLGVDGEFESSARIRVEEAAYRGVNLLRGDAQVAIRTQTGRAMVSVDPLIVVRAEGAARIALEYNGVERDLLFQGISTLHPRALTDAMGILTNGVLDTFEFEAPFHATGEGLVAFRDRLKTEFSVRMQCGQIRSKGLAAKNSSFTVRMRGATNWVEELQGNVYGGRLAGNIAFARDPATMTPTGYRGRVEVTGVDGASLASALGAGPEQGFSGTVSGFAEIAGPIAPDVLKGMTGRGRISIQEGRVFSLPIFGGFTAIMRKLIPGLDFVLRQSEATASFTLAGGRIHAEEIHIKGDVLSLSGHGNCGLDGTLDFLVRVRLMKEHTFVAKLIAPLVYPISKLFEFRLQGTLEDPRWYPVNLSRELLQRIGLAQDADLRD